MTRRSLHLPLPPNRVTHVCIFERPIFDKSPAGWKNQLYILNSNTIWYMKIHVAKIPPWGGRVSYYQLMDYIYNDEAPHKTRWYQHNVDNGFLKCENVWNMAVQLQNWCVNASNIKNKVWETIWSNLVFAPLFWM